VNEGFRFSPEFLEGIKREWLITNGLGGYASSTIFGLNQRAYHGLLIAALKPPVERTLTLSSLDEEFVTESGVYLLGNHQYPGAIYPQGFNHLAEFEEDPMPTFLYETESGCIEKTVFMVYGENTTAIRYHIEGEGLFRINPLMNWRNFHAASSSPLMEQEILENGVRLSPGSNIFLTSSEPVYTRDEVWFHNIEYLTEKRRGLAWKEDLFSPGRFEIEVDGKSTFCIMASLDRETSDGWEKLLRKEIARQRGLRGNSRRDPKFRQLSCKADQFLVKRDVGKSIIAGYHWFNDWGRDAMIALPGLLLVTRRFEEAKAVLETFAGAMKDGLLPNDFGAQGYNTVDASPWFVQAVYSYWSYTEDLDFVRTLWPSLKSLMERYSKETPGSRMDSDGLIISGPGLTWMDAKVESQFVTPRAGKACEINALWYNALKVMEVFAKELDEFWDERLADLVKRSYQKFWNPENGCLYDVIEETEMDSSIRPNQIIAAFLPFSPLTDDQARGVVEVVTRDLLTPFGLRTLSPKDPAYVGRYEGSPRKRDRAYHQGTVWPWLMGPYITAYIKTNGHSKKSRDQAKDILAPLMNQDFQAGVGTICEVFDGDAPHRPEGCISQAWSVGEVMRCWSEDVMMSKKLLRKPEDR